MKNAVMNLAYRLYGESRYTSHLSNMGIVKVPASMEPYVERFDCFTGPPRYNTHGAAVVSYGGKMNIAIVSAVRDTSVERRFFTGLVKQGIPVLIESNHLSETEEIAPQGTRPCASRVP